MLMMRDGINRGPFALSTLSNRCSSPMVALAGVGSYGTVFHTKIARGSGRAYNVMIPKCWCAPAVFSIPIARSILQPSLANASQDCVCPNGAPKHAYGPLDELRHRAQEFANMMLCDASVYRKEGT